MQFRLSKLIILLILVTFLSLIMSVNAQSADIDLNCGDVVQGETTPNDAIHRYRIIATAGTTLNVRVEPVGSTFNVHIQFLDAGDQLIAWFNETAAGGAELVSDFQIGSTNPILRVTGDHPDRRGSSTNFGKYFGAYRIFLGCDAEAPMPQPAPVRGNIEIPMQIGQQQVAPVGTDVILYTFDANADSMVTLTVNRMSDEVSAKVSVIHQTTEQTIFIAGMPGGNNLSVELTLPESGTYAISVSRFDTPTQTGSNGAVQILIE